MRAAIPRELLLRLLNATPEQYAAVAGILGVSAECGIQNAEYSTPHPQSLSPLPRDTPHPTCGHLLPRAEKEIEAEKESPVREDVGRRAAGGGGRFVFRRSGQVWEVVHDGGGVFHLADTLGARYLDYLLHRPGAAVSAYDLEVAIRPERGQARARNSIQATLDPTTVKTYLRELERLRRAREAAGDGGDLGGADRMDAEIEALEEALRGGQATGDVGERARNNVSKAVAAVRRRLAAGGPAERAFGEYLGRCVSTGYECQYRPAHGERWA